MFKILDQLNLTSDDNLQNLRIDILQKVDELGSITAAAKALNISYKTAWDAINHLNNITAKPLLIRETGGKGGGRSILTEEGKRLLQNYIVISSEYRQFIKALQQKFTNASQDYQILRRASMQISARNQISGRIKTIHKGAVNHEVIIDIGEDQEIVAIITSHSCESMFLNEGKEVMTCIKASHIILGIDINPDQVSSRNCLAGIISHIELGAVNAEVSIDISMGITLAAIVTLDSIKKLKLTIGSEVYALIKASDVLITVFD